MNYVLIKGNKLSPLTLSPLTPLTLVHMSRWDVFQHILTHFSATSYWIVLAFDCLVLCPVSDGLVFVFGFVVCAILGLTVLGCRAGEYVRRHPAGNGYLFHYIYIYMHMYRMFVVPF
jgi:hypothetical protein